MRVLLLLVSLATGARAQQSGPPSVYPLSKENGGLATFYSSNRLQQGQSPLILNGYLDADAAVVKRNGYQTYGTITGCTQPLTGGWPYVSLTGTYYVFIQCGGQMYVTSGNGSFSAIGSTITTINPVHATTSLGFEWFTDGIDDLWYTNGITVTSVTTAPFALLIGTFENRILLSNVTGGPPASGFTAAQSGTWLSGYQNGSDYSLPAVIVDTSAAFFPLNGSNDTRQVTCEFDGFKNVQLLWNNGQMWGLYGTGNSSFVLQLISNEIGCTDQGSVQEYNGRVFWLSKRGLETFDGTSIKMISWPIQNQVQSLIALQKNFQVNVQKSQADWQAGNLTASGAGAPMNATYYPGNVAPSSWSVTDNGSTALAAENLVSLSTQISPGFLTLAFSTRQVISGAFGGDGWTCAGGDASSACQISAPCHNVNGVAPDPTCGRVCTAHDTGSSPTETINILRASDNSVLQSFHLEDCSVAAGTTNPWTCPLSQVTSTAVVVQFASPYQAGLVLTEAVPTGNGLNLQFDDSGFEYKCDFCPASCGNVANCSNGTTQLCFDYTVSNVRISSYAAAGSITSARFNTSFSTPTWGDFTATISSSVSQAVNLYTQTSSDNVTFGALIAVSANQKIGSAAQQYIDYVASFTTTSGTMTPTISLLGLSAETTGYFITQCIQPTSITSWGAIQSDNIPNGGSFTYWVSTAATCANAISPAAPNWTQQTLNTTISVATAAAVAVRVLFSLDVATEVPRLQDITLNYVSGVSRPPLTSTIYNKRYYISYTTNTSPSAYNDHVLVFDTNDTWTLLDDIFASSLYVSNLLFYSGSSKSDGVVYAQDAGTVDNGSPFNFVMDTPDIDFGSFAAVKDLDDWWIEAQGTNNSAAATSVNVQYFVDGGTTPYSAGTFSSYSPERGYLFSNGYFGLNGSPSKAHTLRLRFQDQSASPLRLYQTNLRYWTESLP